MNANKVLKNKKGQGLIEYLIIVAIVAVGSMAVIKVVGANVGVRFANIANVLGGKAAGTNVQVQEVTESMTKKKDFSNFFDGATNQQSKSKN
ncbi:Flp family type IVb pilin [Bdellovibrio sp. HCB117]|uniref:Pilus assembly protein n=1 Tax=Bdellovibrio bacteriovorus TaxID=959 RepID=A0A150WGV2_BDEBC|nr:hypothetical protein [Bdellovibrio bacteriovorus]KYG62220.1 hypothetical protein AZI85_08500 [Bdellovibrio bacteriovorus]